MKTKKYAVEYYDILEKKWEVVEVSGCNGGDALKRCLTFLYAERIRFEKIQLVKK